MKNPQEIHDALFSTVHSLLLSTVSQSGEANASYAPFIRDTAGNLFIFISGLAKHSQNLLETHQASILIIEDEQSCRQLFARNRISYQCSVSEIKKSDDNYSRLLDKMQDVLGNTLELLRTLADFRLIELTPKSGHIVTGFGQTYPLPLQTPS